MKHASVTKYTATQN